MATPLDRGTNVLVTVEDPPWFEALVREWEQGGCTCSVPEEERSHHPEDGSSGTERTEAERIAFASEIRDLGHQYDLERANQRPVVSIHTPPHGFPAVRDSGVIHVTRKARERIETGAHKVLATPRPDLENTQYIDVTVGSDETAQPADPGRD